MSAHADDGAAPAPPATARWQWGLAGAALAGVAVSGALAAYAQAHPGDGAPLFTLWFGTMVAAKTALSTVAAGLVLVQVGSALGMYLVAEAPRWVTWLHRWAGVVAFGFTLPVVFACVWSLGFETVSARVLLHGVAGCVFFGVFTVKMLALRVRGLPGWVLPVLGGLVVAALAVTWSTSGLWYLREYGL